MCAQLVVLLGMLYMKLKCIAMNVEHYKTLLTLVWRLQRLIVLPCSLQHQVLISLKVEKTKHLFIKLTRYKCVLS